ncbi:hypothetical protein LPYR103PRE_21530 [Segatella asaccharophila]
MKNINYISAGAGSGKTYTLTHRLADYIIAGNVKPEQVILTTFTEKAAEEFREKAKAALNEKGRYEDADRLDLANIGTVHSIANKMINKYWYILGLSPKMNVMDENDVNFFISQSLADLPNDTEIKFLNNFCRTYNIVKKKDYGYGTTLDYNYWEKYLQQIVEKAIIFNIPDFQESQNYSTRQVQELYKDNDIINDHVEFISIIFKLAKKWKERYKIYKRDQHTLDFNDMEQYFLKLLNDQEVSKDINSSYKYLFVDEFQDSSPVQVKIFDRLSDLMEKSYFVGDSKQAIYGFRGTDAALTQAVTDKIKEEKEGCKMEEPLDTCWRSQPDIIRTLNKVFIKVFNAHTEEEITHIKLKPCEEKLNKENKDCLTYLECGHQGSKKADNISHLAMDIAYLVANGEKPEDIAVLARSNNELDELAAELKAYQLPVYRDSEIINESKEKGLLFSMLRLLVNRNDLLAKAQIEYITQPEANIGNIIDRKIDYDNKDKCQGESHFLEGNSIVKTLLKRYDELHSLSVAALVETLVIEFDLKNISRRWDRTCAGFNIFDTLISLASRYEDHCQQMALPSTIDGYMNYIGQSSSSLPEDANGIQLYTYHGSKGLEWKNVIVMSLQNDPIDQKDMIKKEFYGISAFHEKKPDLSNLYPPMIISVLPWIFGNDKSIKDGTIKTAVLKFKRYNSTVEDIKDESKRLLYVALTRAQDHLYLAAFKYRSIKDPLCRFSKVGITVNTESENAEQIDCLNTGIPFKIIENNINDFEQQHPSELTYQGFQTYRNSVRLAAPLCENDCRDQTPSTIEAQTGQIEIMPERIQQIKHHIKEEDVAQAGSCIHQIFCSLDRQSKNTQDFVSQVISEWGLNTELSDIKSIIASWDSLSEWIETHYGNACNVYHELPFKYLDDQNHIITGDMDLVWETNNGVVLADYKTFPGQDKYITNPQNEHYAGNYKGQFDCYTYALKAHGERVLDRYVFYPVNGMIIKIL